MAAKSTKFTDEQKIGSTASENANEYTVVSTNDTDENTEPEKLLYVQQAQDFFHAPVENENTVFALVAAGEVEKILENKLKYNAEPDSGKGQLSDIPFCCMCRSSRPHLPCRRYVRGNRIHLKRCVYPPCRQVHRRKTGHRTER